MFKAINQSRRPKISSDIPDISWSSSNISLAELSRHLKALKPKAENVQYPTPTDLNSTGEEVVGEKIKQRVI